MLNAFKTSPLFIGLVLLIGFLLYLHYPSTDEDVRDVPQRITPVVTSKAQQQAFPVMVEAIGTTVANESVNITSQETQTITKLAFEDGSLVAAGQLLVQLNDRAQQARLNEIDVNLAEAERQLRRLAGLAKERAVSEQRVSEQEARVKSLTAQREVAIADIETLTIRAPFAGKLGTRQVSVGSLVRPGDVITTLDDLSVIKVDFSISELHLASLVNGQRVTATSVAYPSIQFEGKITNVDTRIDPVTRSIKVRAQLPNPDLKLRPGMLLQINLEKRVLDALVIPESALMPDTDKQFVFVVENNQAVKTEVQIGERKPGWVVIRSGLINGQTVVSEGTLRVRDGSNVKVLESK